MSNRLAYVVVKLKGTVRRNITVHDKEKGLVTKATDQPAGFMVYFPRGHALRIRDEAMLKHYNLHRPPIMANLEGLHAPDSPVARMLNAQSDEQRQLAYADLEKQVIQIVSVKAGRDILTRDATESSEQEYASPEQLIEQAESSKGKKKTAEAA